MLNFNDIVGLTDGFFLLFLAVSGNFIAETLGCETQFLFSNNLIFKQIIVFLVLFLLLTLHQKMKLIQLMDLLKRQFFGYSSYFLQK